MSRHERRRRNRRIEHRRATAKRALLAGAGLSLGATLVTGSSAEAATFTVSNLNDSGAGSLRQAILDSNTTPGADVVTFQSTLSGQITLGSQLSITDPVQVLGPGANRLTISGNNQSRIFYVHPPGEAPVTIAGLTLTAGNSAADRGGAIRNKYAQLTVDHVVISNSVATANQSGGGIENEDASLTVRSSTISGNSARAGGGIYSIHDRADVVTIQNSTITGNSARYSGGGIMFTNPAGYTPRIAIGSSTISGNSVTSYASYGGGGGIWLNAVAGSSLLSTIVADNSAPIGPDIRVFGPSGSLNTAFSLIENPSGAAITGGPNITAQDPKLLPLADNGGPTPTEALAAGSPAIDQGQASGEDQRGAPRPFDFAGIALAGSNQADIGAYERVLCGGKLVNRVGTAGKDKLKGTKGSDGILGLGGKDTLKGLKGNDGLCGGPGKDKLKGGAGNDRLLGQAGNDTLIGGKGKDKLKGGKGKDKQKQ